MLLQQADAAISSGLAASLRAHQEHLAQLQAAQEELIRSAAMSSCLEICHVKAPAYLLFPVVCLTLI